MFLYIVEEYVKTDQKQIQTANNEHEFRNRFITTTLLNIITLIITIFIPNITILAQFQSALACLVGNIIPGLCMTSMAKTYFTSTYNKWLIVCLFIFGIFNIIFGILLFFVTNIQTFIDLNDKNTKQTLCV